jgi:FKBP-type peptidyl-prolyl cis-trans isomerase SlyD
MEITEQCVVALTWTLKDTLGEELDVLDEPVDFLEPRALFPAELEEGMSFEASALPKGSSAVPPDLLYTVTEIYPEHVVLDGNHPLAGIALRLRLRIEGVREATEEEIGRGSAGTGFFRIQPMVPGNDTLH